MIKIKKYKTKKALFKIEIISLNKKMRIFNQIKNQFLIKKKNQINNNKFKLVNQIKRKN